MFFFPNTLPFNLVATTYKLLLSDGMRIFLCMSNNTTSHLYMILFLWIFLIAQCYSQVLFHCECKKDLKIHDCWLGVSVMVEVITRI